MSEKDPPPSYSIASEASQQPHNSKCENLNPRSRRNRSHSWKFKIRGNSITDGMKVFVSDDSVNKYKDFKGSRRSPQCKELQNLGIGVPLLKVKCHSFSFHKFLTIYKYYINDKTFAKKGFDPDKDYYEFCKISKEKNTYVLLFTPDRNNPQVTFKIEMYTSPTITTIEYEFNGKQYRWIKDSSGNPFNQYSYSHFLIGEKKLATLEEEINLIMGKSKERAQLTVEDIYDHDDLLEPLNYESIFSVNIDALTTICMSLIFKREEDVKERLRHMTEQQNITSMNRFWLSV
ncbi:uncharacterized protein RJT21DRAFT_9542 [Scheffersomyces amazonensis]|uniref:uncharacterized protein n=1 Tax=Scheffersomyces amazonensis TaxID=1078765 RepID=UPI00315DE003